MIFLNYYFNNKIFRYIIISSNWKQLPNITLSRTNLRKPNQTNNLMHPRVKITINGIKSYVLDSRISDEDKKRIVRGINNFNKNLNVSDEERKNALRRKFYNVKAQVHRVLNPLNKNNARKIRQPVMNFSKLNVNNLLGGPTPNGKVMMTENERISLEGKKIALKNEINRLRNNFVKKGIQENLNEINENIRKKQNMIRNINRKLNL